MKIKKQTVTETEVEIKLPYFLKVPDTGTHVGYINENQCIVVREKSIEYYNQLMEHYFEDPTSIEVNAEEFTRKFDRVLEGIQNLLNHSFLTK